MYTSIKSSSSGDVTGVYGFASGSSFILPSGSGVAPQLPSGQISYKDDTNYLIISSGTSTSWYKLPFS